MLGFLEANLPHKRFDPTSTAVHLIKSDLSDHLRPVIPMTERIRYHGSEERVSVKGPTNFRSFFIFSISPGSFSAKVSLRVYSKLSELALG